MTFTIKNEELRKLNNNKNPDFPKYVSQLINWANQNAQGTRPKVVGQLSELFPEYINNIQEINLDSWKEWYLSHYPDSIDTATEKIFEQIHNLKGAIAMIDKNLVRDWVEDLVIAKTYNGLYVQEAILKKIAEKSGLKYRLAKADEESKGIDGYVGKTAYSIKPHTYKTMARLSEEIKVKMIYYTKTKAGIVIEVEH